VRTAGPSGWLLTQASLPSIDGASVRGIDGTTVRAACLEHPSSLRALTRSHAYIAHARHTRTRHTLAIIYHERVAPRRAAHVCERLRTRGKRVQTASYSSSS
jgi:hypothetical protein